MSGNIKQFLIKEYSRKERVRPSFKIASDLKELEEKYNDRYLCIHCKDLVRFPVRQLFCGHSVCEECLDNLHKKSPSKTCPGNENLCSETDLDNPEHVVPAFFIERKLKNMGLGTSNSREEIKEKLGLTSELISTLSCEMEKITVDHCQESNSSCSQSHQRTVQDMSTQTEEEQGCSLLSRLAKELLKTNGVYNPMQKRKQQRKFYKPVSRNKKFVKKRGHFKINSNARICVQFKKAEVERLLVAMLSNVPER